VTIRRTGAPDASTTRTFVVWSSYAQSRARGVLEPPAEAIDPLLHVQGTDLVADVRIENLEPEPLRLMRRRVDRIPCNPDVARTEGADEAIAVDVGAESQAILPVRLSAASWPASVCGAMVHYWGATTSGKRAQSSVVLDREGRRGSGPSVDEPTSLALAYVTERGLTQSPYRVSEEELVRLYRERKIPSSVFASRASRLTPQNVPTTSGACSIQRRAPTCVSSSRPRVKSFAKSS